MRILCLGDSNTYGYDPCSYFGGRYDSKNRWVDLLSEQSGWEVLNAGMNGREVPKTDREVEHFIQLLSAQKPLNLLLVMLGSNDLLQGYSVQAITSYMQAFLSQIPLQSNQIVVVAPPPMKRGAWVENETLIDRSIELISAYQALAKNIGCHFIDPARWGIDVTFDGVHFSEQGHHTFAKNVQRELESILIESD